MFISASGPIQPEFFLLTLGHTCRYLIQHDGRFSLFDVGASVHVPALLSRLSALGLSLENLEYIFVSHAHADRVGGIPLLKKSAPKAKICGTNKLRDALQSTQTIQKIAAEDKAISEIFPQSDSRATFNSKSGLSLDKVIVEGDAIQLSADLAVRALSTPGHTEESTAYFIQPYDILIADETLGYYQGARPPSPGADASVSKMREVVRKLSDHNISALCLLDSGVLTGSLIQKHLKNLLQTMDKIVSTYRNELAGGLTHEQIDPIIRETFYISESSDPVVLKNLNESATAVINQVPGLTS